MLQLGVSDLSHVMRWQSLEFAYISLNYLEEKVQLMPNSNHPVNTFKICTNLDIPVYIDVDASDTLGCKP